MRCAACGAAIGPIERVGRRDRCDACGADLHSCRNCRVHDRARENECREPQAERVVDKTRSNFCDYFTPAADVTPADAPAGSARADLERLFRKG